MTPDALSPGNVGSQRPVSDWRSALHDLADILRITAPSIALVTIGAIAVVGSSQSIEAIRVLAEDCDAGHPAALVVFVAAMIFAGLSAWYLSDLARRKLTYSLGGDIRIVKGLSVNFYTVYQSIDDQFYRGGDGGGMMFFQ